MSSSGLGELAVISTKDSVSSILGSDMYRACRFVHALMCAAFRSGG